MIDLLRTYSTQDTRLIRSRPNSLVVFIELFISGNPFATFLDFDL